MSTYTHSVPASTVPVTLAAPVPSTISLHTAPDSTYVSPHCSVTVPLPLSVTIGLVVSTIVIILLIVVATFPLLSVKL